MKKNEKEVEKYLLNNEIKVRDAIKRDYAAALKLVKERIAKLTEQYEKNPELQSKVYQRQYQQRLKEQLEAALSGLSDKTLKKTTEFLETSYVDAYIGANYNITAEGSDLFLPYDQAKMNAAIYKTTAGFSLSKAVYDGNVDELRKKLQSVLSRGLNSGMDYSTIARMVSSKMEISYGNAKRIIATEGHRIQNEAKMACMYEARAAGADIVKEWSSTMDSKTRERHQILDGQVRELEDPFTALGADVQYPGGFGIASEDINCRCCLLQRSRKALSAGQRRQLESYKSFRERYKNCMNVIGEFRTRNSPNAGYIVNERATVFKTCAKSPENVRKCLRNTVIEIGGTGASSYDYVNDIMYIVEGSKENQVLHEIGHAIDNKLINREKVDILLREIVSDVKISDLEEAIFYDNEYNEVKVILIKSDRFISEYQGRIYVKELKDAFDDCGNIKIEYMLEYVSEGYREYMMNPSNLMKNDPKLYQLIKEVVE